MGNLLAIYVAPTADDRIQRAMQTFELTKHDMLVFWNIFKKHDVGKRGMISTTSFFDLIHEPRTLFGDALFDLIECVDDDTIDFGEFVAAICTYCFFEIPEILKFCFFVFDRDKNGFVPHTEFRLLIDAMHNHAMNANVVFALDRLKEGKFYFDDFVNMHAKFPSVLFPAFRLQNAMMSTVGGERWWNTRKTRLVFHREALVKKDKMLKRKERRDNEAYRQSQIRRHMGPFRYYCMPWERARFNVIYPTATVEEDDDDEPVTPSSPQSAPQSSAVIGRTTAGPPPWGG